MNGWSRWMGWRESGLPTRSARWEVIAAWRPADFPSQLLSPSEVILSPPSAAACTHPAGGSAG